MYNVIICDDIEKDRKKVETAVKEFFASRKLEYRVYLFQDYNSDFYKMVKSSLTNKIYLLDIETPSRSGIDVARDIRDTDVGCVIAFLTGHVELGQVLLNDDIMFLNQQKEDFQFNMLINQLVHKVVKIIYHLN